jgi:hypothetical protein
MPLSLKSSGGGSVTLDTPSTASTYTLTVPAITGTAVVTGSSGTVSQGMLASGVAGNGPAFSAYQTAAQTITANTYTKLSMNVEEYDTASCYDTSLYRFTPNIAGYYLVTGTFEITTAQCVHLLTLYKNGNAHKRLEYKSGLSNGASGSAYVYLNGTTDYIELYAFCTANNAVDLNSLTTWWQAALARAA